MFLVTSVAMLRERSSGTLERLLAMPLGKGDLLGGYALAFGSVAVVQTLLASALCLGPLGLPATSIVLIAVRTLGLAVLLGGAVFYLGLDRGIIRQRLERAGVDAHRKDAEPDLAAG